MASVAKGPEAFRTISEAADMVGVPQHVLRFWETRFPFVRPMKRAGGRRFYRPADVELLRGVRVLLQQEGYTIKGVQRLHREQGAQRLLAAARGEAAPPPRPDDRDEVTAASGAFDHERLRALLDALLEAKHDVDAALARCASGPQ